MAAGYKAPTDTHETDATLSSAKTLTPPVGATGLLIQVEDQNIRIRLDGVNPTASMGFQLKPEQGVVRIDVMSGMTVRVIEETTTASIQYLWVS